MKQRKKFTYDGIELVIAEVEEPYMNSIEPVRLMRVLAPNGGHLPLILRHKQTLKSIEQDAINLLDSFKNRGADINFELTKQMV